MQQQQPDWELKINDDESMTRTICVPTRKFVRHFYDIGQRNILGVTQRVCFDK